MQTRWGRTTWMGVCLVVGGCAVGEPTEPSPPAVEYPLAQDDPAAQLDPALLGLPIERAVDKPRMTNVDAVASEASVRFIVKTGERVDTTATPAQLGPGKLLIAGFEGQALHAKVVADSVQQEI